MYLGLISIYAWDKDITEKRGLIKGIEGRQRINFMWVLLETTVDMRNHEGERDKLFRNPLDGRGSWSGRLMVGHIARIWWWREGEKKGRETKVRAKLPCFVFVLLLWLNQECSMAESRRHWRIFLYPNQDFQMWLAKCEFDSMILGNVKRSE